MKFLIRDDDPCAFTNPSELLGCYQHIWDEVPVNLSVTPFRIPGNDPNIPRQYRGIRRVMPLSENKDLTGFLKEMVATGKIDVALHGYHHDKESGMPEYVGGTNLLCKTSEGKVYLQEMLDYKINTFVPPHNGIGREGIKALVANKLNLVGIPSLVRSDYRDRNISHFIKYWILKYYQVIHRIPYPYVLSVSGHKEVAYCSVTPSQRMECIYQHFNKCMELDGVFIFATHYHAFNKRLKSGELIRDALVSILDKANSIDDVEFCTYRQLWDDK